MTLTDEQVVAYAHFLDAAALSYGLPGLECEVSNQDIYARPPNPAVMLVEGLGFEARRDATSGVADFVKLQGDGWDKQRTVMSICNAQAGLSRVVGACVQVTRQARSVFAEFSRPRLAIAASVETSRR